MTFKEKNIDLFTVGEHYYLAHCIASDLRMGAGIAVEMQRRFQLRGKLNKKTVARLKSPTCILTDRVFNLITKEKSSGKPTYDTLKESLKIMAEIVVVRGVMGRPIEWIAMPTIGCGLDRLYWPKVRQIVTDMFRDINIDILVCKGEGKK